MKGQLKNDGCNEDSSSFNSQHSPTSSTIENIPNEVLLSILNYVPSINLLLSASRISRQFHCAIKDNVLWKLRLKALAGSTRVPYLKELNLHQRQRCCLFTEAHCRGVSSPSKPGSNDGSGNDGGSDIPGIAAPKSLLLPRDMALHLYNQHKCVALSTTTDNEGENIENVLPSLNDINGISFSQWGTYWSSAPCPSGDPGASDEVLLFTTACPNALISEVAIKPFTEVNWQRKTYTWCGIVISVYQSSEETNDEDDKEAKNMVGFPCVILDNTECDSLPPGHRQSRRRRRTAPKSNLIKTVLSKSNCRLVYQSQQYDQEFKLDDEMQTYKLPPGIVGNMVTFTLVGKNFRQFPTSGFYACVDRVEVKGTPLLRHARELEGLEDVKSWFV